MTRIDLLTNPMTTAGDIITGDTGGVPQRLAAGSEDDVLTIVSGEPAWSASAGSSLPAYITDNLQPDEYPGSPNAVDDEFEGGGSLDVKWTVGNDPGGADTPNQTDVAGILHIGLLENTGTDNVAAYVRLTQTAPTGTATARYRAKVCMGVSGLAGEDAEFAGLGLALIDVSNGISAGVGVQVNNATTGFAMEWRALKDAAGTLGNMSTASTAVHRPKVGEWAYLELRKTTTSAYTSSNTYEAWVSFNGIAWFQIGTDSVTFTATPVLGFVCRRPKSQTGTPKAEAYVDFFRKTA